MKKKFKMVLVSMMVVLSLGGVTACGGTGSDVSDENNDILEREVELGNRLEEKAKDNVEQQGQSAEDADEMLDSIPTD
jgi:hypothetical protein